MKSKAHMKKCLELGVSVTMDETEIQEHGEKLPCVVFLYVNYTRTTPTNECFFLLKSMTSSKSQRQK